MKTSEKIDYIEKSLEVFNKSIFKNKKYMLLLKKVGNKYCLQISLKRGLELKTIKYNTYDDIISTIELFYFMFDRVNN